MRKPGYSVFDSAGLFMGRKRPALILLLAVFLFGCNSLFPSAFHNLLPERGRDGILASQSLAIQASPVSDVGRGRDMFMGNIHFQNGGPPCMGCHNIGNNGILGGGALGPDLTNVSTRYSESDLAAKLIDPGPIMKPIFSAHPLTTGEQVDLLAFLRVSAGQPEVNREVYVVAISLAGLLAAMGLVHIVYRNRLRGVRKPFVKKARLGKL